MIGYEMGSSPIKVYISTRKGYFSRELQAWMEK